MKFSGSTLVTLRDPPQPTSTPPEVFSVVKGQQAVEVSLWYRQLSEGPQVPGKQQLASVYSEIFECLKLSTGAKSVFTLMW